MLSNQSTTDTWKNKFINTLLVNVLKIFSKFKISGNFVKCSIYTILSITLCNTRIKIYESYYFIHVQCLYERISIH